MTEPRPLVSIVCPAFQEEEVLPLFHAELSDVLRGLDRDFRFEILFVDDGSRDRTLDVLRELSARDPRVRYLSLSRNFGHQAALTAGLEHATGDAVVSLDADLQHPPRVVPLLLEKWREGFEVVITVRADDQRLSFFKRATSKLFYQLMGWLSETEIRLSASDFRLLSRKAVQALLKMREQHRFVRGMVQWLGFPAAEIAFQPDERRAGRSKYTFRRMLRLAGDGLFSFTQVPLRIPAYLGLAALMLAAGHLAWSLVQGLLGADGATLRWHYLLFTLDLLGGCILCALGFLGEYVGRIYDQVKQRPLYLLKEDSQQVAAAKAEKPRREAA